MKNRFLILTACFCLMAFALQAQTKQPAFYQWAQTPPMGWNSWDCYGPTVTEAELKANADYMHSKGLKFGIHIMRGIPVLAVKNNLPILGSKAKAADIYSTEGQCKWLHDMYTVEAGREGAQAYYNSLLELYASWGVDFIKVDDLGAPIYHKAEVEMIRKAIDRTGRKIVLSTSPGETPIASAQHVSTHANMWRTIDDFWDIWSELKAHFDICNRWAPYIGNGHFPDADMLPLGRLSIRGERGDDRMTRFTKDEQQLLMSLCAIFRSPLIFGGDLPSCDPFTLSLITNREVLHVNQYSRNNHQLFRDGDKVAWVDNDPQTGDTYLALFYIADKSETNPTPAETITIPVKLADLGINGKCKVRDLWQRKDIGTFSGIFTPAIRLHGAGLYRVSKM